MLALFTRRHVTVLLAGISLALLLGFFTLWNGPSGSFSNILPGVSNLPISSTPPPLRPLAALLSEEDMKASMDNMAIEHIHFTSSMTSDGTFFPVEFDHIGSYNPNIIPHPYRDDTYIMIAQRDKQDDDNRYWYTEIVCEAQFRDSKLQCVEAPMNLPIAATSSPVCDGHLISFNNYIGPHDARILFSPTAPYILYGSQAKRSCLGMWIQDLRRVVDWGLLIEQSVEPPHQPFFTPTELQRPGSYSEIEKNWFPFWDVHDRMYLHYDLSPGNRVFAEVDPSFDGSVGPDLASLATTDAACMLKYLPRIRQNDHEYMHQATNSLRITLCNRNDLTCHGRPDNVFIFSILHHKTYYNHGVYEPYAYLFSAEAPFALYAIGSKPFWIPGRGEPYGYWSSYEAGLADPTRNKSWVPQHQSQMLFVVSINWKQRGQNYDGYLDDEIFVSFGVEDQASAGVAVRAGELLAELHYCGT